MRSTENLIAQCLKCDTTAQYELYQKYSPKMFGVCLRFAKCREEAEDILQEGFIKVFRNLKTFRNEGKLEAWIRRIMVNTAINFYKRKYPAFPDIDFDRLQHKHHSHEDITAIMSHKEILETVQKLPKGYRMVFNLYVIEGYTHKEIGNMLNISVNTSKSQLSRAKDLLKIKIAKKERNDIMQSNFLPQMVVS
jgi:RNA polymerase sigma-70 factor (ECF subfamily)